MSYLIMVVIGFIMIGIGTAGYLSSNVIVKHTTNKETHLVDSTGKVISQIYGEHIFERYELKEKEVL